MLNNDSFLLTENLSDNEKRVDELYADIDIRMLASSLSKGTGDGAKILSSGSLFPSEKTARKAVSFKQWEGTIITIEDENQFIAKVQDIAKNDLPKFVRFDRRKVEFENSSLFAEGASFFWKVGVFYNEKGTANKRSEIRFRLLPPPNPNLLKIAEVEMSRIFEMLSWIE